MTPRRQDRVSEAVRRLLAASLAEAWPLEARPPELARGRVPSAGPPGLAAPPAAGSKVSAGAGAEASPEPLPSPEASPEALPSSDWASLGPWPVPSRGSLILVDRVRLSPDLRQGEVWVHTLPPAEAAVRAQLIAGLNKNASRFQTHIARALRLRFTPRLVFRWHPSVPPLSPVPPVPSARA